MPDNLHSNTHGKKHTALGCDLYTQSHITMDLETLTELQVKTVIDEHFEKLKSTEIYIVIKMQIAYEYSPVH